MNKRGTGTIFCCIAAFLYTSRYIIAAIWGSSSVSWDKITFQNLLSYSGNTLLNLSAISLIIAIIYLILAEIQDNKEK